MREGRLFRGILQILSANVLNLFFSVGTAFILPKFLSVDAYSQIKTYQLYITYTAVFHLGYNDGMILKYGGKSIESLEIRELQTDLSTVRIFQMLMTFGCIVAGVGLKDPALFMAACTVFPNNMINYFKNLYQAVGEFKKYSNILNWTTILTFAINLILVSVLRTDCYTIYLSGYLLLNMWIWFRLEVSFCKTISASFVGRTFSRSVLKSNISSGFLLLTANLSSMLLTGIDRFFVKGLLTAVDFAQYAFVASMENFLNVAVTPVSVSLYHYFCVNQEKEDVKTAREWIISFAALVITGAFAVRLVLEIALKEYLEASVVLFVLFASHLFMTVIKCLYVNLYKARKQQKKYSEKLVVVIVLAVVLNIVCFMIHPAKEAFAAGTFMASVTWFLLCQIDFKDVRCTWKQNLFLTVQTAVFLGCGLGMNAVMGALVYVTVTAFMIGICMPGVYKKAWKLIKK